MHAIHKELKKIIFQLPPEKVKLLLEYASILNEDELTLEDIAEIETVKDEFIQEVWDF